MANRMLGRGEFDAVICLGAVIRGETPHFNFVAAEVSKGIGQLSLQYKTPVIYGIITADTFDQAFDRAGGKAGNRGSDAALCALEMANLNVQI
jgi:6,7-dimethyl-8-ribityllumazine synthase